MPWLKTPGVAWPDEAAPLLGVFVLIAVGVAFVSEGLRKAWEHAVEAERAKDWIRVNGLWIIAGIAIGAAGLWGWNWYKDRRTVQAEVASARYEEMVEAFNDTHNANPAIDTEAQDPWELPVSHRSQVWDLEQRLSAQAITFGSSRLPMLPICGQIRFRPT